MIAPSSALASIPERLSAIEAAPLMCAGITTYNALRNSGARVGDAVAILGIGGLGHLGIQFAAKMGFRTAAIGRGKDKEDMVKKLVLFTTLIASLKMLLKSLSSLVVVVKMVEQ